MLGCSKNLVSVKDRKNVLIHLKYVPTNKHIITYHLLLHVK